MASFYALLFGVATMHWDALSVRDVYPFGPSELGYPAQGVTMLGDNLVFSGRRSLHLSRNRPPYRVFSSRDPYSASYIGPELNAYDHIGDISSFSASDGRLFLVLPLEEPTYRKPLLAFVHADISLGVDKFSSSAFELEWTCPLPLQRHASFAAINASSAQKEVYVSEFRDVGELRRFDALTCEEILPPVHLKRAIDEVQGGCVCDGRLLVLCDQTSGSHAQIFEVDVATGELKLLARLSVAWGMAEVEGLSCVDSSNGGKTLLVVANLAFVQILIIALEFKG